MMKLLRLALLCIGIATIVAGDTPTIYEVFAIGSGDGFSTAETDTNTSTTTEVIEVTTESPCASVSCPSNSECIVNNGSYECICNEPYQLQGDSCIIVCQREEVSVDNERVYYDVTDEDCQNITANPPSNYMISVVFAQAQVGTTVTANVTCNNTCDNNIAGGAIGYARCDENGTFLTPTWIDCSLTNASLNQQLSLAVIATSNPNDVTSDTVDATVEIMQDTADEFMVVTNNLLRVDDPGAQERVESKSNVIIQSVQSTSQNVVLETAVDDPGYNTYENVQSEIAMGVVQLATASTKEAQVQPRATGENRLSYIVYTSVEWLFPSTEANILSNDVVFSVSGSDSYTMQFPITSDITIDDGATNEFEDGKKRLDCIIWDIDNAKWNSASDCTNYAANKKVASCTCTTAGQYSMRSVTITQPSDELSAGAIVGIVIGSVAGAAIIAGLVYYFGFRKKKHHNVHMHDSDSISSRL